MGKENQEQDHEGVPLKGQLQSPQTRIQPTTAGRDLDALIAEKVFGAEWETFKLDGYSNQLTARLRGRSPIGWILVEEYVKAPTWYNATTLPRYSTDIAAAMEVAGRLRELGWIYCTIQSFTLETEAFYWNDNTMKVKWWAEFSRYRSPVEVQSSACDTASLAICLAALSSISPSTQEDK